MSESVPKLEQEQNQNSVNINKGGVVEDNLVNGKEVKEQEDVVEEQEDVVEKKEEEVKEEEEEVVEEQEDVVEEQEDVVDKVLVKKKEEEEEEEEEEEKVEVKKKEKEEGNVEEEEEEEQVELNSTSSKYINKNISNMENQFNIDNININDLVKLYNKEYNTDIIKYIHILNLIKSDKIGNENLIKYEMKAKLLFEFNNLNNLICKLFKDINLLKNYLNEFINEKLYKQLQMFLQNIDKNPIFKYILYDIHKNYKNVKIDSEYDIFRFFNLMKNKFDKNFKICTNDEDIITLKKCDKIDLTPCEGDPSKCKSDIVSSIHMILFNEFYDILKKNINDNSNLEKCYEELKYNRDNTKKIQNLINNVLDRLLLKDTEQDKFDEKIKNLEEQLTMLETVNDAGKRDDNEVKQLCINKIKSHILFGCKDDELKLSTEELENSKKSLNNFNVKLYHVLKLAIQNTGLFNYNDTNLLDETDSISVYNKFYNKELTDEEAFSHLQDFEKSIKNNEEKSNENSLPNSQKSNQEANIRKIKLIDYFTYFDDFFNFTNVNDLQKLQELEKKLDDFENFDISGVIARLYYIQSIHPVKNEKDDIKIYEQVNRWLKKLDDYKKIVY